MDDPLGDPEFSTLDNKTNGFCSQIYNLAFDNHPTWPPIAFSCDLGNQKWNQISIAMVAKLQACPTFQDLFYLDAPKIDGVTAV